MALTRVMLDVLNPSILIDVTKILVLNERFTCHSHNSAQQKIEANKQSHISV